jgi:hypothetical protein
MSEQKSKRKKTKAADMAQADIKKAAPEKFSDADPPDPAVELLSRLNSKHAVTLLGGKVSILSEVENTVTGCPDVNFSSVSDFMTLYRNREKVPVPSQSGRGHKYVNCASWWLDHPARREFSGVVFDPGKPMNGYYNLWRGFSVVPKEGDWSKFGEHILQNICGGNEAHFNWLMDWLADLFQSPGGRRPGTAVVLRGKQGTGKGVFTTNIGKILGPHFVHVSGQHRLTGRFNNHLKAALLVFCDEGWWAGDKRDAGTLKALITEPTVLVEPKFQDAFQVRSFLRVIMASNSHWVVPADLEERRFFVLDVSDERMQDHGYFADIQREMDNGGHEAMLHDLLNREIMANLRQAPRTRALFDQMTSSMDSVTAFWFGALKNGSIVEGGDWPLSISKADLRREYAGYCQQQRILHPLNEEGFSVCLFKICPLIQQSRPIDPTTGKRPWTFALPPLGECRLQFQAAINMGPEIWGPALDE